MSKDWKAGTSHISGKGSQTRPEPRPTPMREGCGFRAEPEDFDIDNQLFRSLQMFLRDEGASPDGALTLARRFMRNYWAPTRSRGVLQ